nr:EOG090X0J5E [Chydorus sphaericus]
MSLLGRVILSRFRFPNLGGGLRKYSVLCVNQPVVSTFPCSINRLQNVQPLQLTTNQSLLSVASNLIPSLGLRLPSIQQTRSVTKWSPVKGKRKTVKAVVKRFYRLAWGAWIRPMVGRHKHLWTKNRKRKIRGSQHVFCNATQSKLLDKMVTRYWRRRRFYVDDIYEPYHTREEFPMTAKRPH